MIKSVAFTIDGEQLAVAALPNNYVTLEDGGAEQDMARTWTDTATTLRDLAGKVPRLGERVAAIAVTGQGDGIWLIDAKGEPVAPAWLWLDSRAASITEDYIASPAYDAHYKRTGTGVNACQQSVQLTWMKRHRPEVLARATSSHHCKDWLYFKLTGERVSDPSEANFTFGNYRTANYEPAILDDLGTPEAKRLLPRIVNGTEECHGPDASGREGDRTSRGNAHRAGLCRCGLHRRGRRAVRCRGALRLHYRRLDRHAYAPCPLRRKCTPQ